MDDKKRPLFSLEEEGEFKNAASPGKHGTKKGETQDNGQDTDVRRVVIVGIDISMTNIILLLLKFFLVLIPVVLVLGALLGVVWELATHGTL